MTQPKTQRFGAFLILVGDGASPEVFAAPCGFTEKALNLKANTGSTQVPDCDNADLPAWLEKDVQSIEATVTGEGILSLPALKVWRDWFFSAAHRNIRVQLADTKANGGGYYQGAAVLTSLGHTAAIGDKLKLSVNVENTGAWTWMDAAN